MCLIHNDCYRGGCHLPEHMMMRPMFVGDRALRVRREHRARGRDRRQGAGVLRRRRHRYLPGRVAPAAGQAASNRGEYVEDVWRIVLANHRTPHNTWGDFHAMIGSLETAERRIRELAERYDGT